MVETNIETMIIPELGVAVTTSKKYEQKNVKELDLYGFMDETLLAANEDKLREDQELKRDLIKKGLARVVEKPESQIRLEECFD